MITRFSANAVAPLIVSNTSKQVNLATLQTYLRQMRIENSFFSTIFKLITLYAFDKDDKYYYSIGELNH